jgi:hypothetical protein
MAAKRRVDLFNDISLETMTRLQNMLGEINPYVAVFKQAREVFFFFFLKKKTTFFLDSRHPIVKYTHIE